jgi:hypothetical protein
MDARKNDLQGLVVSQDDIATDVVAKALQGLISIVKETGEILPSASFDALDNSRKILVYLLGLRACALLNLGDKRLHASPDEIADFIGVTPQRAREYLSRLKGKYLLKSTEGWQLPSSRISATCSEIIKK